MPTTTFELKGREKKTELPNFLFSKIDYTSNCRKSISIKIKNIFFLKNEIASSLVAFRCIGIVSTALQSG